MDHLPKPVLSSASHLTSQELLRRRFVREPEAAFQVLQRPLLGPHQPPQNPLALHTLSPLSFCHFHILSDSNQNLYKPCNYIIKSAQASWGYYMWEAYTQIRSIVPSLCVVHSQKAQKHLPRTFKRNGEKKKRTKGKQNCKVVILKENGS